MKGHLIVVSVVALHGQGVPDAAFILERSAHALDAQQTYQFHLSIQNIGATPGGMTAEIAGMKQGKMHIEIMVQGPAFEVVYDGESTWTYVHGQDTFIREVGREGWAENLLHTGRIPAGLVPLRSAVREETILVDGERRDCWVVERTASIPWPVPGAPKKSELQETTWIDKNLWIDWQVVSVDKPEGGRQSQIAVRKNQLRLDPDLPDSVFISTPPLGTRERFTGVH